MCNSRDIESRYLGLSLLKECIEYNVNNLVAKMTHVDGSVDLFEWSKFIEIGINAYYYKFGDDLFDLISRGHFKRLNSFKMTLIEDDKSNK